MSPATPPQPINLLDEAVEDALARLHESLGILETIDAGELLAQLPRDRAAARRHQTAVSLLTILRRELEAIAGDLEAAQVATTQLGRIAGAKHSA